MAADRHHVIIGNGVAGVRAATVLRERDPDNRITIISIGGLLFYDRYQLPQVFEGKRDWRAYLVHPPDYYDDRRIAVRRKCRVTQVDPRRRVLMLAHREEVGYDTLLIASGGGGYLPPRLSEYGRCSTISAPTAPRSPPRPLCPRAARRSCSAATSSASTWLTRWPRPAAA